MVVCDYSQAGIRYGHLEKIIDKMIFFSIKTNVELAIKYVMKMIFGSQGDYAL